MKANKRYFPADIQGESDYFRITLMRTIQTTSEAATYYIKHEQYSKADGRLLNDNSIYTDHIDKPFTSLIQVQKFIEEDAIEFHGENVALSKDDREYFTSSDRLKAWEILLQKLKEWISENGEPINIHSSIN